MKYLSILILFPLLMSSKHKPDASYLEPDQVIQWMTWEEAVQASSNVKKKIIIDVYTQWCGWCKVMDSQTFADPGIAAYVNQHFYAVKLDAEQKEPITWNGQEFKWIPTGKNGVHTLAYALCDGKMSFPSLVYLNEDYNRIRVSKGFKDANALLSELQFAAEEQYLTSSNGPRPILEGR
jgi:thioredoxin-related protein